MANPLIYAPPTDDTGNPLTAGSPTLADAWSYNADAAQNWISQQRAESVRLGLVDPQTGWPTKAGLVNAAQQYANGMLLGTSAPGEAPGFTAYHGSPHSFDRFDTSKIGTGEGAQAYGHGLYFAENEGVARGYRDALTQKQSGVMVDGTPAEQSSLSPGAVQIAQMHLDGTAPMDVLRARNEASLAKAKAGLASSPNSQLHQMNADAAQRTLAALDELKGKQVSFQPNPGWMYEVNIAADPAHFLDWDKPRDQLSPTVQDYAKTNHPEAWENAADGASLYKLMAKNGGEQALVQDMAKAGIPGIRYLDAGSRGAGTGTSNHVIFDANTLAILRKYGIAGLMAGGATAASKQSTPDQ